MEDKHEEQNISEKLEKEMERIEEDIRLNTKEQPKEIAELIEENFWDLF